MSDESAASKGIDDASRLPLRHIRIGLVCLLVFLSLGMILETLHGFKFSFYLDVDQETRRLMWTLAHAHGTLLALVHFAFVTTVVSLKDWTGPSRVLSSRSLTAASVLMPLGFLLGGFGAVEGDPGTGVLLVIPGGTLLFVSILLAALAAFRHGR